ncbi:LysR family transcriptional regulator [Hylemonella gracilis str. Niagara R]|uniref:LysR family transcriptional regulator n=1 Tax=Hylemonella gracilis str. Niagara R TaxID=1458275 RepID=A0A016XE50_9BURK|nr:LysR family transcriptional regulator [Hylemonella gracilis]EYC50066.1 LysR family transcriptional regulator [Hylemonella gracilis str. Niagara R]
MDRFDAITAFVAVARSGGFSAASRALGMPVANVSRKVALLEEALGVRLLVRTTRHVALTDGGKRYFETCSRVLDAMRDADEEVSGEYREPKGDLVITAPLGFGQQHLQPVVHEFLRAYAQVNVHLQLVDRVLPLVEEHVDCALRIGTLGDSSLVARELGAIRVVVCAAPAYLQARGTPLDLSALAGHDCISWTGLGVSKTWTFSVRQGDKVTEQQLPVHVRVSTSTPESALQAAIAGLGLVQATSYQVAPHVAAGRRVPVLTAHDSEPLPVSLVYPSKRLIPLKLRALLDFATPRLEQCLAEVDAAMGRR